MSDLGMQKSKACNRGRSRSTRGSRRRNLLPSLRSSSTAPSPPTLPNPLHPPSPPTLLSSFHGRRPPSSLSLRLSSRPLFPFPLLVLGTPALPAVPPICVSLFLPPLSTYPLPGSPPYPTGGARPRRAGTSLALCPCGPRPCSPHTALPILAQGSSSFRAHARPAKDIVARASKNVPGRRRRWRAGGARSGIVMAGRSPGR